MGNRNEGEKVLQSLSTFLYLVSVMHWIGFLNFLLLLSTDEFAQPKLCILLSFLSIQWIVSIYSWSKICC